MTTAPTLRELAAAVQAGKFATHEEAVATIASTLKSYQFHNTVLDVNDFIRIASSTPLDEFEEALWADWQSRSVVVGFSDNFGLSVARNESWFASGQRRRERTRRPYQHGRTMEGFYARCSCARFRKWIPTRTNVYLLAAGPT